MTKKRLSKVEKLTIEITDATKFKFYRCAEHGVFALKNEIADGKCRACKADCEPYKT